MVPANTTIANNQSNPERELKETRNALKRQQALLKQMIDISPNAIFVRNREGNYVLANRAAAEIMGTTVDELIGKPGKEFNYSPEQDERFSMEDRQVMDSLQDMFTPEEEITFVDGSVHWIQTRKSPIIGPTGKADQVLVMLDDITRHKQVEAELRKNNWALNERVKELHCLYELSRLVEGPEISLEDLLTGTLELIPPAWQHPEATGARIILDQQSYTTDNFRETKWMQTSAIVVGGDRIGEVSICYLEDSVDDPFLKEEMDLLETIVERLGRMIESMRLDAEIRLRNKELEGITHISTVLRSARGRKAITEILIEKMMQLLNANIGAIYLSTDSQPAYLSALTPDAALEKWLSDRTAEDLMRMAGQTTHPYFLPSIQPAIPSQSSTEAAVVVPLHTRERIIGAFFLAWQQHQTLPEEEKNLLVAAANIASNALDRSEILETLEQQVRDRTQEVTALYEMTTIAAAPSFNLPNALEQFLKLFLIVSSGDSAVIHLLDEDQVTLNLAASQGASEGFILKMKNTPLEKTLWGWVIKHDQSLALNRLGTDERVPEWLVAAGIKLFVGIPIRIGGRISGVISIYSKSSEEYTVEKVNLLAAMTDHIGTAIERDHLYQQAQHAVVIQERQRLARNLHDDVAQSLYSLNLLVDVIRKLAEAGEWDRSKEYLNTLGKTTKQVLKEMRMLVYELRPHVIEEGNLVEMLHHRLKSVEQRSDVKIRLEVEELIELHRNIQAELFYISQEALNNSLKHAAASAVTVRLHSDQHGVTLEIEDNGTGFNPEGPHGGFGLVGMQERARNIGGTLEIQAIPGKGTKVRVNVPGEQG